MSYLKVLGYILSTTLVGYWLTEASRRQHLARHLLGCLRWDWKESSRRTVDASQIDSWLTDVFIDEDQMTIFTRVPDDIYYELHARDVHVIELTPKTRHCGP